MIRLLRGLGFAVIGYVAGGVLGYFLLIVLSSNQHDRDVEAAMTGAFVTGPLLGIVGAIVGFVRRPGRETGRQDPM